MQAVRSILLGGLAPFVAAFLYFFNDLFGEGFEVARIVAGDDAAIRHHFLVYHCFLVYLVAAELVGLAHQYGVAP
jgi:hypothetical protein